MKARSFIFRNVLLGTALLVSGALALTSCSVDETDSISGVNTITFSTEFTRATATTINNLNEFTVWGWKVDDQGNGLGTLMNGVTAANSGNGTYDTTDKNYYWPGCDVDFLALSPVGVISEETEGRFTSLTYAVPETAADQIDLLYAYTPAQSSGKVPMNFRHALSQVEFKAMNTNSLMTVEIDGVKVASVVKEGVLTLPTESTQGSTDDSYGTWTYEATETAAYAAGLPSSAVTLGSDATTLTAEGGSLFLIPQTQAAWVPADATNTEAGAYFLISCRIEQLGVELWPGTGTCAEIAIPCEIAWEQGKKYTYTFVFGDGAGYYPPTDDTNPGDAIFGNPIHFTVDVDDFDGTGEDFSFEPVPVPTNHYEEYLYTGGVQIGDRFYTSEDLDSTTNGVIEISENGYSDFPSGSNHYVNGVYFVDSTNENGEEITLNYTSVGNIERLVMIGTDYDKKAKVKLGTDYAFFPEPYDKITVEVVLYNLEIDCTGSNYPLVTIMREAGKVDYIAIVDCDIALNLESYHGLIGTSSTTLDQYFAEAYISNCVCSLGPSDTSIINLGDVATGTVESLTMTNNLFYDATSSDENDFHIFSGSNSPVEKFIYNNNTLVDLNTETGVFKCASIGDVTAQYNLTYVDSPIKRQGGTPQYLDFVFFGDGSGVPTGTTSISDNIAYHGGEVYTTQSLHWYWFYGEYEDTWQAPSGFTDCQVITEDPFSELNVSTGVFTVKTDYSAYGHQTN